MRHYDCTGRNGQARFFERRPGGWYLCGDPILEERIEDLRALYGDKILFGTASDITLAIKDQRDE